MLTALPFIEVGLYSIKIVGRVFSDSWKNVLSMDKVFCEMLKECADAQKRYSIGKNRIVVTQSLR